MQLDNLNVNYISMNFSFNERSENAERSQSSSV